MPEVTPAAGTSGTAGTAATPDVMAEFRTLLRETVASAGTGAALSERESKLLRENFKVRDKLREANALVEAAKKTQVADGATVLTVDDAKEYAEFKKLGVPAKDVAVKLAERDTLATTQAARDARELVDTVAEELGIANVRAFQRLVAAEGLTITMKTVKVKDEETGRMVDEQVPVVRKRGQDEKVDAEPLVDVLERDFADDLDTLLTEGAAGGAGANGDDADATDGRSGVGRRGRVLREPASRAAGSLNGAASLDTGAGGTRFPRLGSRAPTGANASRKAQEEAVERKSARGGYAI
jgi:hypothetical protein